MKPAIVVSVEYSVGGGSFEATPQRFVTALERAGAAVADVGKHVMPRLVSVLEAAAANQFNTEGSGTVVGSWAPLSVEYAKRKSQQYPGRLTLEATGALRRALTDSSSANARRDIDGGTLTYGTRSVPYASFHQTGTSKMPARPPVDFSAGFTRELTRAAQLGIIDAVREASDGVLVPKGGE